MVTKTMSAMKEIALTAEELRTAARSLASAADSLIRLFSNEEETRNNSEDEPAPARRPLTLEEVRGILSDLCARGYGAQVKALIAAHGAKTLKDVNPAEYDELTLTAQAIPETEGASDA